MIRKRANIGGGNKPQPIGFDLQCFATINNTNTNSLVSGTSSDDEITNYAGGVTIRAGGGDDVIITSIIQNHTINNSYGYVTVDGGAGEDIIVTDDPYVSINGGAGADLISVSGSYNTIGGGEGNDTIASSGSRNIYRYAAGDGNDYICGFGEDDTLQLTSGSLSTCYDDDDDYIIVVGNGANSGTITLCDAAGALPIQVRTSDGTMRVVNYDFCNYDSLKSLSGTSYADRIFNVGYRVSIGSGAGNDLIYNKGDAATIGMGGDIDIILNYGEYVSINGGNGNDYLLNEGDSSTLVGGDGNDTFRNGGDYAYISGGAGDDYIINNVYYFYGWDSTLDGGTGDDTIIGSYGSDLFLYKSGDGDDIIINLNESDTINITDGSVYATVESDEDLIVSLESGSMTLKDAVNLAVNIVGGSLASEDTDSDSDDDSDDEADSIGISIRNSTNETLVNGSDGSDTITNSGWNVSIVAGMGADSISNRGSNVTIDGGKGSDTIGSDADSSHVLVDGGAGGDAIDTRGEFSTILGGAGNDSLGAYGSNSLVDAGDGNDTVGGSYIARNVTIRGGAGTDSLVNMSHNSMVDGGAGNDIIGNVGSTVTVDGGDGNDYIFNFMYEETEVTHVTIRGGSGIDTIENHGVNVYIDGGDGNDNIHNESEAFYVTINGGVGRDAIINYGSYTSINGGVGADTIVHRDGSNISITGGDDNDMLVAAAENASNVYIDGGAGDDTLWNTEDRATISGGDGADEVQNYGAYSTIDGGDGNDTIENSVASDAWLNGGAGNDEISNYSGNSTIYGGVGNDTIYNRAGGTNVSVEGGAGEDILANNASNVQLKGGADSDIIANFGDKVTINGDEGDDIIASSGSNVILDGGTGDDYIYSSVGALNVTMRGGAGEDTLSNESDYAVLYGGNDTDEIENHGSNVTIDAGADKDFVVNYGSKTTIYGGAGPDGIFNDAASVLIDSGADGDGIFNRNGNATDVTINTGTGSDTIFNDSTRVSISAGTDADSIENEAENVTINGGTGADIIKLYGSRELVQYAAGDGSDTIFGYDSTTTLSFTAETRYSTMISGDNVIVGVGSDSIMILNAASKKLNFTGGLYASINGNNTTVLGTSGNDSLFNYGSYTTVLGLAGNDYIYSISDDSLGHIKVDGGAGNDYIRNTNDFSSLYGGAGNDSILDVSTYTTIRGGTGNDSIGGFGGNKIYQYASGDGNDIIANYGENDTVSITDNSTYTTVISGNNVVVSLNGGSSLAGSITLRNSASKKINIIGGALENTINNTLDNTLVTGTAGNDTIISSGRNVSIQSNAGNDMITGSDFGDLFLFSSAHGENVITNFDANDTLRMTAGKTLSFATVNNDVVVTLAGSSYIGHVTLKSAAAYTFKKFGSNLVVTDIIDVPNGYSKSSVSADNQKFNGTDGRDFITNSFENVTIQGNAGNDIIESSDFGETFIFNSTDGDDTIMYFGDNDTIQVNNGSIASGKVVGNNYVVSVRGSSSSGTVTLKDVASKQFTVTGSALKVVPQPIRTTNSKDNTLFSGSSGNDSLINTGENVTIRAGEGKDTLEGSNYGELYLFSAVDGENIITNFGANDTIKITFGALSSSMAVGNDYVLNIKESNRNAKVTLKGAGGYSFKHSNGMLTIESVNYIVNNKDDATVTGTGGRDYIINPSYDRVTIQANGGNDTITGSTFGEMYLFSSADGNNVITNFGINDTLKMTAGNTLSYATVGNDVVVTLKGTSYTGKVTLKDTAGYAFKKSGVYLVVDAVNTINNSTNNTIVSGTSGRDYITNSGSGVSIQSNGGNDTITGSSFGEVYLFSSAHGSDLITNFGKNDSIKITGGSLQSSVINGNNIILNVKGSKYAGAITLGGAASLGGSLKKSGSVIYVDNVNRINNSTNGKKVLGTSGRDYIVNSGSGVTIQPGGGNDIIEGSSNGELYLFSSADGYNLITNFGINDSLQMTSGRTISYSASEDDMIVTLAGAKYTGTVTLGGAADYNFKKSGNTLYVDYVTTINNGNDNTKVTGTGGRDYIINTGEHVTIQSGGGNDTIEGSSFGELFLFGSNTGNNVVTNFGRNDTLKCTAGSIATVRTVGDDAIVSLKGTSYNGKVTLRNTGSYTFVQNGQFLTVAAGVNTINNSSDETKISGTDAADYIVNAGQYVTIDGNGGNDTIESSSFGETFLFDAIDGNDVIFGFDSLDALRIVSGTLRAARASGNDYVVSVAQGDSVGTVTLKNVSNVRRKGDTFVLDGVVNKMINRANSTKVVGTALNDSIINTGSSVTINGGAGNDTITGSSNGELYLFSSADGNDLITNFGKNDTLRITSGEVTARAKVGKNYVVTVKSALYSGKITLGGAAGYVFNEGNDSDGAYLTVKNINYVVNNADSTKATGTSGADYITNSGVNVSIAAGAGNDTIEGSNFGEMYLFSSADGNNVVTNFGANDSLKMTNGRTMTYAVDGNDVIVILNGASCIGTVKLLGAAGYDFKIKNNVLSVNSVNNIVNTSDGQKVTGTGGADYIVNTGERATIQANGGNDTIYGSDEFGEVFNFSSADGYNVIENFGVNDTLRVTAGSLKSLKTVGNDAIVSLQGATKSGSVTLKDAGEYIFNRSGNVLTVESVNEIVNGYDGIKVVGTGGRDYVMNSGENVSIQAGAGSDTIEGSVFGEVFLFSSADGNNVVTNFGLNDTLKCTAGSIATVRTVGDDAIVSLKGTNYSGLITLQGAGGYNLKKSGNALYVAGVREITNTSDGVKVVGTSGADYVVTTGEHVTVQAGGGSDTITGSDEYGEFFAFSSADGNNLITNFGKGDTLRMTAGKSLTYVKSGDDYVLTMQGTSYTGHVTLSGAATRGELVTSRDGRSIALLDSTTIIAQLPSDEYWFEQDASDDELGDLISDVPIDNALAMLDRDEPISLASAWNNEIMAIARHQSKK